MGTTFGPLVTVSATYGTGGSVIAPRLADALGVPFLDRLISADMSDAAARRRGAEGEAGAGPAARPTLDRRVCTRTSRRPLRPVGSSATSPGRPASAP